VLTVVNKYKHTPIKGEIDIYIGRGSILGNPYTHLKNSTKATTIVATREEAINLYRDHMKHMLSGAHKDSLEYAQELARIKDLHVNGKIVNLVCFCKPKSCHGDIIKEWIDENY